MQRSKSSRGLFKEKVQVVEKKTGGEEGFFFFMTRKLQVLKGNSVGTSVLFLGGG